jgi:DNA-binding MarR family transcriptional regulator
VAPTDDDYARLLAFRDALRQFLHWSEEEAGSAGLTGAQYQLLLVVRGHGDPRGPTIGDVAEHLMLRHHSAVGLADRCVTAGLVRRVRDEGDHRVVRLRLTASGSARLRRLAAAHLAEAGRLAPLAAALTPGDGSG